MKIERQQEESQLLKSEVLVPELVSEIPGQQRESLELMSESLNVTIKENDNHHQD
jgi:hypothetical protein